MRHLYLDHRFGNDGNDGLSKETAKHTQEAVFAVIETDDTVHADFLECPIILSPRWQNVTITGSDMQRPPDEYFLERRNERRANHK